MWLRTAACQEIRYKLDFNQEIPFRNITQRHVTFSFSVDSRDDILKGATTLSPL
jgi:hypothetical protein